MNKLLSFIVMMLLFSSTMFAQVAINADGSAPDPSAALDVQFNDKGVLIPRMNASERLAISSPAFGLLVYQDDTPTGFWYYDYSGWMQLPALIGNPKPDFVIKYTSEGTFANSQIYDNGAGVGIGTTAPDASVKLDVIGPVKITDGTQGLNKVLTSDANGKASWQNRTFPSSGWSLTGNTGTLPNKNFIGTIDSNAFDIRTNNLVRTRITTKGAIETYNTGGSVFAGEGSGANDDLVDNYNVFVGYQTGYSNTGGHHNTANGFRALFSNTTGLSNVAIGAAALYNNTVRGNLVAVGDSALYNNGVGVNLANSWEGNRNSAIGSKALFSNTTGGYNTATGYWALYSNTSGSNNTAYGVNTMISNTTGTYNTAIGNGANVGSGNLTNATVIGANAQVNTSNSLVLGSIAGINGATASVSVGIGTTSPATCAALDITSTTKGFLPPRMTTAQMFAISSPAVGMIVFNISENKLLYYCGQWVTFDGTYYIGQQLPNGIIFYLDEAKIHGMMAAPTDNNPDDWGCFGGNIAGAYDQAVGTGYDNTEDIVDDCDDPCAARQCWDLDLNGYDDWFLPSKDELWWLWQVTGVAGGFNSGYYWSSSECGDGDWGCGDDFNYWRAWAQQFSDGHQNYEEKNQTHHVRCVREF